MLATKGIAHNGTEQRFTHKHKHKHRHKCQVEARAHKPIASTHSLHWTVCFMKPPRGFLHAKQSNAESRRWHGASTCPNVPDTSAAIVSVRAQVEREQGSSRIDDSKETARSFEISWQNHSHTRQQNKQA
jgi:hypothetical protein